MSRVGLLVAVGAKGGPGATTAVLALALGWPVPVLVVDADPAGGDMAAGWLAGRAGRWRGLLGFATATRHLDADSEEQLVQALMAELVVVPEVSGVFLLPGLGQPGQAAALDPAAWSRLATAATARVEHGWVDALMDCGRLGSGTAWSLLTAADMVLLVVRPTVRGCHHAANAIALLTTALGGLDRVGLGVCGPGPYSASEVGAALGLPVRLALPPDPASAAFLSDGGQAGRLLTRSVLLRTARAAATPLQAAMDQPPAPMGLPAVGP